MEKQWYTMFPGVNNFVFLGGAGSGKSELSINFALRLAGEQDVKRILAVYYQQDMVTEHFDSIDGERWVTEHG